MTSPATVRFTTLPPSIPRSTLRVAVIDMLGTGAVAANVPVEEATLITESNKSDLGTDGGMLDAYEHLTARASPLFYAVPVAAIADTDLNDALDALITDVEKEKMDGFGPDIVVLNTVGVDPAAVAAEAPITKATGHAVSNRWAAVFVDAKFTAAATQANYVAWAGDNAHDGILAVGNAGSGTTPGRVLAAEHYIRHIARTDLGVNPIGISFPAADVGNPAPHWAWGIESAAAPANVLADADLSVFIQYAGDTFLWGGGISTSPANSALDTVGHRLVGKRMSEQTVIAGLSLVGTRVTLDQREGLQTQVQEIADDFVSLREAAFIVVHLPRVVAGRLRHAMSIGFFDTVDTYELDVEVGHVET